MEIDKKEITVRELVAGYVDSQEEGVVGFSGKLNIRPPYQREFVYNDNKRKAVIDTVTKGYPLNTMYWAVTSDGFEIIDGQQRTVSICQYFDRIFSYEGRFFHNLQPDEAEAFLNYKLTVYQCKGIPSERLAWFRTINIAGEELKQQEIRNATFAGTWTADAKRYFSKTQCPAWQLAEKFMEGSTLRQDYLETAISWLNAGDIDAYMGLHQDDPNATPLWQYFQNVFKWVNDTFPKYRSKMKGVGWGVLYNAHKGDDVDPEVLEKETARLMADDDVKNKSGIYEYLLTKNEKHLNIRRFTSSQKVTLFEQQNGVCYDCKEHFEIGQMHADHINPWSQGGKTELSNG